MGTPSRFTRIKITAGYLLLLSVIFFSLLFIHREMQNLSVLDTEQLLKTDSLMILLRAKDENTISMLRTLNETNERLLSMDELEQIISREDTIIIQQRVQHRITVSRDSMVAPVPKKNFFKRLADAFVPPKDTAVLVNTTQELTTDTLLNEYNPSDSLQQRIREASQRKIDSHRENVRRSNARLRAMNNKLTARIDSLIHEYQHEIILQATQEAENHREIRRRSTLTIGAVAVGAILLSAIFLIIIMRDITRSNRYRHEIERANKRAEELLQARENLMLTITHDFKAPLGSIIGYIDLLSQPEPGKDKQQEYLANMKSSSDHLLKLVTDLLDFHRLDLNKAEINRVKFNPARLFDEIRVSFEPLIRNKNLKFGYEITPELDAYYISDPHRIRQIVNNLLSNAVKFTPAGSITLTVSYALSQLTIAVTDTGKGMNETDKERIFQEFTRLSGAQGQEGFGLGLSIVSKLVQLLEGSITVDSVYGKGSTFTVGLPLYPVPGGEHTEVELPTAYETNAYKSQALRVLMIDDDRIQLDLTSAMLQRAGMSVVSCLQPDHLIEHLRNKTYDVLLTDVQMPAINGFDLLRLLRASNIPQAQTIPVIAVTARSEMNQDYYRSHGFAGYLNKPFTASALIDILAGITPVLESDDYPDNALNFGALTEFAAGDRDKEQEILDNFAEQTRINLQTLKEALTNKDTNTVAYIAHKMIPLFKLFGARQTAEILHELEKTKDQEFTQEILEQGSKASKLIQDILDNLPGR